MPNTYGLYKRSELRDYTRRLMNGIRSDVTPVEIPAVPPATEPTAPGTETLQISVDPLFSNTDINLQLNSGLVNIHSDMVAANGDVFQDEQYIDIATEQLGQAEYPLPDDIMQLRALYWKDPQIAYTFYPPIEYIFMHKVDEPAGLFGAACNGAPTYRTSLGRFIINEPWFVNKANPKGVKIRYIKWPQPLDNDDAYVETQFARLVQEVLVRRAAIELIELKTKLDASPLKGERDQWIARLMRAVADSFNPLTVQFVARHPLEHKVGMPR